MNAVQVASCRPDPGGPAEHVTCRESWRAFRDVEQWMLTEALKLPLHEVEAEHAQRAREVHRLLYQEHVRARGNGDVGPQIVVLTEGGKQVILRGRVHECHLTTVFGEVAVNRQAYSCPGQESIHPLEKELQLPERSYSYEVQRHVVRLAAQGPFEEATATLQDFTGVSVPKRSAEAIVIGAAQDVDAFYEGRQAPPDDEAATILVSQVDGKGIPMIKPDGAEPVVRRKKGEKANKKRMATVATVHIQEPRVRTPQEVVDSLFSNVKPVDKKRIRPKGKRVWASLSKGKDGVIKEVAEEAERRDPERKKRRVALTDGERALQRRVLKWLPGSLLILDLFHVLEKLWKAAYVFHPEGSQEAEDWVRRQVLRILEGGVSQVVKGLRQSATKRGLKGNSRKVIRQVTGYFYRNRPHMRYNQYLAEGFPIASGSVEGACKNLVKDRFERSGMRWSEEGAEAVLKVRAAHLSADFEDYWQFHIAQEQARLHPEGLWEPVRASVGK